MAYKRMQTVPNMMISYQSTRLLKYVKDPTERLMVWETVVNYFEYAREKGAIMDGFQVPNVSEPAKDAILEMIASIDEGIDKFWAIVDRNKRVRNSGSATSIGSELTNGRPMVTTGDDTPPQVTNKDNTSKINENKENSSIINIHSSYVTRMLNSERSDEFQSIINALKSNGFTLFEDDYSGIARKMLFEYLDEKSTYVCISICKQNNIYDMDYFFKVFNNQCKWAKI